MSPNLKPNTPPGLKTWNWRLSSLIVNVVHWVFRWCLSVNALEFALFCRSETVYLTWRQLCSTKESSARSTTKSMRCHTHMAFRVDYLVAYFYYWTSIKIGLICRHIKCSCIYEASMSPVLMEVQQSSTSNTATHNRIIFTSWEIGQLGSFNFKTQPWTLPSSSCSASRQCGLHA